ncbi:MAG: hypothetical protein QHI38_09860 [Armatimonadota bacterium]|nr:hypothetical protein [Armatimonadota bacterium]
MYTVPLPQSKINQSTRERIGEAVYLLAYFINAANWSTGALKTTCERIAAETGFPQGTIRRWISVLAGAGEITVMRVGNGTLIQITDYEAVARTRKVDYKPRRKPSAASDQRTGEVSSADSECSSANTHLIAREQSDCSSAADALLGNERNNISTNMMQSRMESTLQSRSSHSSLGFKAPADCLRNQVPRKVPVCSDPWLERVNAARAKLDTLDEQARHEVLQTVMGRMAQDPRPFVSGVVKCGASGELEPRDPHCEQIVLVHVLEYFEEADKAGQDVVRM